jgi:hypothetical protein
MWDAEMGHRGSQSCSQVGKISAAVERVVNGKKGGGGGGEMLFNY